MVTQVKKKKKIVKGFDKKVAIEFKKTMEAAAEISGQSKIELLTLMGYQPNNAKQIFSNEDRNLPAYHVPEFCKKAGNNLIAEWIAEQLGMKLVPADSKLKPLNVAATSSEVQRLKERLKAYEKKFAEITVMLMDRFNDDEDLNA